MNNNDTARITELEKRLADTERRIAELERAPFQQGWPQGWPKPIPSPDPWNKKVTCPQCGMDWEGVMGYCCPNSSCPMGAGPIMCFTKV